MINNFRQNRKFLAPIDSKKSNIKIYFANLATVFLLASTSVNAGVIFEKKPQLKNFSENVPVLETNPKPIKLRRDIKTTTKTNDEKSQKVQSEFNGIGSLNPQAIALPGTIVCILGLAFIAYKLDSEFASFMDKSTLRPNDIYGAGYEPVLKDSVSNRKGLQNS